MTIVLIGPVCTGKSTVLAELGRRLDRPTVDLDDVAEPYYEEVGRGRAAMQEVGAARGDLGTYRWWQEGHPHAVRCVLRDHPGALVALGGGHTVYDDPALFDEVAAALAPHTPVLLLPSADLDRSLDVLRARALARNGIDWVMDGVDILAEWIHGDQNHRLAAITVFAEDRTPGDVAEEILRATG